MKRDAIEVGTVTLERVAAGAYEWRDSGLRRMSGARKRAWEADERRQGRARTEGT